MAKYPNITLTNAGLSMIAESQGSGQLIFTAIKLGDGSLTAGEDIKVLAAVKNPLLISNISNIDTTTAGQTTLTAVISNAGVASGFFARELGVYAKVGTGGTEKLYAYTNAGNYADYMPDKTAQINENQIKITLIVGNAANVTAIIDGSIVYPTKETMTESITEAVKAHDTKPDSHAPAFAAHNSDTASHADIRAALKKAGGVPIGTITARLSKKPEAGELALDTGALVSRTTYPDLWAWVQANAPLISEADWQAQAAAQTSVGAFSTGDGSTTFRLMRLLDYFRGGAADDVGKWQGDAIRNITGTFGATAILTDNKSGGTVGTGALRAKDTGYVYSSGTGSNVAGYNNISLDSSLAVPTADENRPKTIKVLYCVKAFDAETNPGLVDLTALANDVAGLSANVNNSFAVIYPNNGTATTPATVSINSRYVCANPFLGYYVQCKAEIKYNGKWCETGWTTTTSSGFSDGVKATQLLPDDNIIVQTGVNQIALGAAYSGNGFGTGTTSLGNSPLPCRVLVWKGGKLL